MPISDIQVDMGSVQSVINNLVAYEGRLHAAILIVTDVLAKKMEGWAKDNATWTDRTSNARQGIKGNAYWETSNTIVCSLSHTVEYGIWLELANERKYAILEKSINQFKPQLIDAWKALVKD